MFTGIIERVGRVAARDAADGVHRIRIAPAWPALSPGESVAVNGVCLTVEQLDAEGRPGFALSPETIACSAFGSLAIGASLNLERAMVVGGRLSGHIVQGHVDGLGHIVAIDAQGDCRRITAALPAKLHRYCVEKGSITLDGISLTLNRVAPPGDDDGFEIEIMIVPHSWAHTNLSHKRVGDPLHVEVDVIAKYVERLCNR
jgi:riboflavin synthase